MPHTIIGTAGHIDHGKTALVKALTGVDTDRLKEEKQRGLTIDLGFAHWGDWATIIDVPGHERFVRNMVAGVSTIDLVLFVVAADDGVMPQTREHLDILNILQVRRGLIVITKTDLVEADWLALVKEDVQNLVKGSFLEGAEVFPVSAVSNEGVAELAARTQELAKNLPVRRDTGVFWMPVDRVFSIKGFGTVLTGSVLSGSLSVGDAVEILPKRISTKVRSLQRHSQQVQQVKPGDRAAINLQSVEKNAVYRGCSVTMPGRGTVSSRFDAKLRLLQSAPRAIKTRTRIRVHFGTAEVMARVSVLAKGKIEPGQEGYVQLNLEEESSARRLDSFVIRQYSPTVTIGGGQILSASAPKRKLSDKKAFAEVQALEKEEPAEVLETRLLASKLEAFTLDHFATELATDSKTIESLLAKLSEQGKVLFLKKSGRPAVVHKENYTQLTNALTNALTDYHKQHAAKVGIRKAELASHLQGTPDATLIEMALTHLKETGAVKEKDGYLALSSHEITLSDEMAGLRQKLDALLFEKGLSTPGIDEIAELLGAETGNIENVLAAMIGLGQVIRAEDGIYFHADHVAKARDRLVAFLSDHEEIKIPAFKDLMGGTTRKYAMALINYFDRQGVTVRDGDVRILGDVK